MKNNRITLACDLMHPRDYEERMQYGIEYQFKDLLALRGGYKVNYDEQGLCGGFGVKLDVQNLKFTFDYAVNDFGIFEVMIHRFSVSLSY